MYVCIEGCDRGFEKRVLILGPPHSEGTDAHVQLRRQSTEGEANGHEHKHVCLYPAHSHPNIFEIMSLSIKVST